MNKCIFFLSFVLKNILKNDNDCSFFFRYSRNWGYLKWFISPPVFRSLVNSIIGQKEAEICLSVNIADSDLKIIKLETKWLEENEDGRIRSDNQVRNSSNTFKPAIKTWKAKIKGKWRWEEYFRHSRKEELRHFLNLTS